MYEKFYGFREEPFRLSPDSRLCFPHSSFKKAQAYMAFAYTRAEGFVMVTGAPGTGKTTLIGDLMESLADESVAVANLVTTQLDADDFLRMVAFSFGLAGDIPHKSTIIQELTAFLTRHYCEGQRALLIVDEAQDLSMPAIEELRLLTNLQIDSRPLIQIFLVGQEELRDLMQEPNMEQGYQRIVAACHLEPLKEDEIGTFIKHRLAKVGWNGDPQISTTIFPIIHKYSLGIPRKINLICGRLFLQAFVEEQHKIGVDSIRSVLTELQQEQLISSDLPACPKVEAGDFSDLEDDYPADEVQSPESESIAEEVSSPTAAISELEVPRYSEHPVDALSASAEPNGLIANSTALIPPPTPDNVVQARFTDAPGSPGPIQSETFDPRQLSTPISSPAVPKEDDDPPLEAPPPEAPPSEGPPLEAPPDTSERPHVSSAVPTDLSPTIHNRRYRSVALSLVGLLAVGGVFYAVSRASSDSKTLFQQAHEIKTSILSKFSPPKPALTSNKDSSTQQKGSLVEKQEQIAQSSVQAGGTEPLQAVEPPEPVESSRDSYSAVSEPDPRAAMLPDKAPSRGAQARRVDKIEPTDDLPRTEKPIVDKSQLATKESPVGKRAAVSYRIDSTGSPAATATLENKSDFNSVQAWQVRFAYGSTELRPPFKELLDEVVEEIEESQYAVVGIVFTVQIGKGSSYYNRLLSLQRAEEIANYLNTRGIAAEQLHIEEDTGAQESSHQSSEDKTSPRSQRHIEVTVLVPTDKAAQMTNYSYVRDADFGAEKQSGSY